MKIHTTLFDHSKRLLAIRGACIIAVFSLTGLLQQANAGCAQVPGIKIPTLDLNKSTTSLGSGRFVRTDFIEVSDYQAPIVGLWAFKYTSLGNMQTLGIPDGAPIDGGNTVWFADGNEITYSGMRNPTEGATCLGVWVQTGENTYLLNHIGLSWNQTSGANGPAGPGGPSFIKQRVTLSDDGQSYSGTFTIFVLGPDGKTALLPALIRGTISATRVTVETQTQEP